MSKQILAIANCRVSSAEQLLNGSLPRQRQAVIDTAKELNVTIPDEYWWSGNVSSKKGTNVDRKDLKAMQEACKKDKRIKYLIVDEPDRFMRSVDEGMYFEVTFRQLGVEVWYACEPQLNKGDLAAKLLKFTRFLAAEGSNDERIHKSMSGGLQALKEGRYPGPIKLGYKKGYITGVQEIHPEHGPVFAEILLDICTERLDPSEALKKFNKTTIRQGKPIMKMDKFRERITDPFYARIVEMNKQIKFRNENAIHEGLITKEQHEKIVEIMTNKKKTQSGPRKNGNPDFPLNNLITHDSCTSKQYPRLCGFGHDNGVNKERKYYRYKCRACNSLVLADDVHSQLKVILSDLTMNKKGQKALLQAMEKIWQEEESTTNTEIGRLKTGITSVHQAIARKVEAATDPSNDSIKQEILDSILLHKEDLASKEQQLHELTTSKELNKKEFYEFALTFINDAGANFFEMSRDNRQKCKQLIFPGGIYMNQDKKVYTTQISPLYRLEVIKKDAEASEIALMVRVRRL